MEVFGCQVKIVEIFILTKHCDIQMSVNIKVNEQVEILTAARATGREPKSSIVEEPKAAVHKWPKSSEQWKALTMALVM